MDGVRRHLGPLVLDIVGCEARVDGRRVTLTMAQWAMLVTMVVRSGRIVTHEELVRVGDIQSFDERVSVRGIILDLRRRLGHAGDMIQSVRGIGYRISVLPSGERIQHPTERSTGA